MRTLITGLKNHFTNTGFVFASLLFILFIVNAAHSQPLQEPRYRMRADTEDLSETNAPLVIFRQGPEQVRAGEPYSYRIMVKNQADFPVYNVVLKENSPGQFEIESSRKLSPQEGGQQRGSTRQNQNNQQQGEQQDQASQEGPAQWSFDMIPAGGERIVEVKGIARNEGPLKSCVTVDYKPAVCATTNVVRPVLKIDTALVDEKGKPSRQFFACEPIILNYRVSNTGSGPTPPTELQINLPNGLNADIQGNAQQRQTNKGIEIALGKLERGEVATDSIRLLPESPGDYNISAIAQAGELTAQSQRYNVTVIRPELALTLNSPDKAYFGQQANFAVTVKNTSDAPAANTKVSLDLPAQIQNVSYNTASDVKTIGDNSFQLGILGAGESKTISFNGTMQSEDLKPGKTQFSATAMAYCAEEQSKSASSTLAGIPALLLEVIDKNDPVKVGEETLYEIRVKNQGTAEDTSIQISAQLPATMEFIDGSGDSNIRARGEQLNFAKINSLAPGDIAAWQVETRAKSAGQGRFKLQLESDALKRPITEMEPTRTF